MVTTRPSALGAVDQPTRIALLSQNESTTAAIAVETAARVAADAAAAVTALTLFAPIKQGYISRATATGTGSINPTIQTIFTVTFTAVAGRRYRISTLMHIAMGGSNGTATGSITDSAGTTTYQSCQQSLTANFVGFVNFDHVVVPGAGSITYLVRAIANAACTMNGSATQPHSVLVEDIGT